MKVIYNVGNMKKVFNKSVLAIGVFDGLHRGHQKLIRAAIEKAKDVKGEAVVMTFHPHPAQVLRPDIETPYIISLPYRIKLIEKLGGAYCIVINFTKSFSKLSPKKFIEEYLMRNLRPIEIFVGDDFRFGKGRTGSVEYFKELGSKFGFHVNAVHHVKGDSKKISSSQIRQFIKQGQLYKAGIQLGRPVSIMGKVVKGDGRGKLLGYPTANIFPENEVLPPNGVYAVNVLLDGKKYQGVTNIGIRPSFKEDSLNPLNIETHIFDFNRQIYGKEIILEFIQNIRKEKIFKGSSELSSQITKDILKVKKILSKHK